MKDPYDRIRCVQGTPRQAGQAMGQALGERLDRNIEQFIEAVAARGRLNRERLVSGALDWMRRLPERFQEELEGMALGAGLPLQRLAEWEFAEHCLEGACSGLVWRLNGEVWLGRNNDYFGPHLWGYVTRRSIVGRIPTLTFGLEGDVFTSTGVNAARLWLHYNYLPPLDALTPGKPALECHIWLPEALETCTCLQDVEAMLAQVERHGGMTLFAVDGKTEEFALYECTRSRHVRRPVSQEDWIAGTNHHVVIAAPPLRRTGQESQLRLSRMETLARELYARLPVSDPAAELRLILSDPGVEVNSPSKGTVFANIACPGSGELWYTFGGGYPAASRGDWRRVEPLGPLTPLKPLIPA